LCVEPFVVVAVGCEVGLDAVAVDVSGVSDVALADDAVVGLILSAGPAGAEDPEEALIAVALAEPEIAVDSAILVVAAHSVDHLEALVADAALVVVVVVAVDRAVVVVEALSLPQLGAVVALALPVDVGLVGGADRLAEPVVLLEAGLAEALVGVAVVVVSGGTVGADSFNADVLRPADALVGDVAEELVDAAAGHDAAGLLELIVGLAVEAAGAGSLDDVESLCAVALAAVEVVDLVGAALYPADPLVDVVELASWALGAEVVDEEEAGLADAATRDPVLVDVADGSADAVAALA
jgi:hypothetical protein